MLHTRTPEQKTSRTLLGGSWVLISPHSKSTSNLLRGLRGLWALVRTVLLITPNSKSTYSLFRGLRGLIGR